jgi:tRNA(fMet)-specific endonuclease VapC
VTFLLDTNAVSSLIRDDPRMLSWVAQLAPADRIVTCTICRGEILFGLEKLPAGQRRATPQAKAEIVLASIPCESVPPAVADHYARVKAAQQRLGLSLDENDLWIASTAFAIGATVVSNDTDLRRISALSVFTV